MQKKSLLVGLFVMGFLTTSPAHAKGTHFILEAEGGYGLTDNAVSTGFWGGTLGVGGKLGGFPARFYLVTNVTGTLVDHNLQNTISYLSRSQWDASWLGGLRIYIPIFRHFRFFSQCLGGWTWFRSTWDVNSVEHFTTEDGAGTLRVSAGFQYRFLRNFSIGIGIDRMIYWGKKDELALAAMFGFSEEIDEGDHTRIGLNFALHF